MFHSMSEGLFKKVRVIEVLWSIRNNNIVIQEVNQGLYVLTIHSMLPLEELDGHRKNVYLHFQLVEI
jgi:hypothetical protein